MAIFPIASTQDHSVENRSKKSISPLDSVRFILLNANGVPRREQIDDFS